MTSLIHQNPNTKLKITWERAGIIMSDSVTTKIGEQIKDSTPVSVGLIGIGPKINMREASLVESVVIGFERTGSWISMMLSTLGFDMVEPMYIEFIVDDFLISMSSSPAAVPSSLPPLAAAVAPPAGPGSCWRGAPAVPAAAPAAVAASGVAGWAA